MQPSNKNNPPIIMNNELKLLLLNGGINLTERAVYAQQLSQVLKTIFSSDATAMAYFYFLEHGAATAWLLQVHTGMPEGTVYRVLKKLRRLQIIEKITKLNMRKQRVMGGPRPTMWALLEATPTQVTTATMNHYRAINPKYRTAEELVQQPLIQQSIQDGAVRRTLLMQLARSMKVRERTDVVQLAVNILHEKGVKIWR